MFTRFLSVLILSLFALPAMAEPAASVIAIDKADTVWLLISSALVMLMVPGLAFFYSGMVHSHNVVATLMHSYMKLCVIFIVWVLWGYSLAFGNSVNGLIGDLSFLGLNGVTGDAMGEGSPYPHYIFVVFQGMFAAITAAIITGAFAERVRLGPILVFATIWVALVLGKRKHHKGSIRPHNLPLTLIGASLIWFGWIGFNGGSALAADGIAALAVINTCIAAGAAAVGWFCIESFHSKDSHVTALGIISGSIAGLVAITPGAGFVTPMGALITGLVGGIVCYYAVITIKPKLGYDDSLDAFGLHGVGGIWGALATGLFATTSVNAGGADGWFYGDSSLFWGEVKVTLIVIAYSAVSTYVILQVLRKFVSIRVSEADEKAGLDQSQHGEAAYALDEAPANS